MKTKNHWLGAAVILAAALLANPAYAQFRTARDPAVRAYLQAHDEKVKAQKRAEREARRQDPHRRLRPYLTLEEIYDKMRETAEAHPELCSLIEYGESVEGRPLLMMKISTGPDRPAILYSANIHGNEMAGNMICLDLIDYFVEGYGVNRDTTYLLDRLDVYVIPVLNPDGMSRTASQQSDYGVVFSLTRKNANKVDLNRNYPYPEEALTRLRDTAGSSHKWSLNYRGPEPLSEPETQALDSLFAERGFLVHVNYHTTGGIILSPPATLPEPLPDDDLHEAMRRDYQDAMFDPYVEHTELQFYPTIGSLDDYIYHRYGALCITLEVGKNAMRRALSGFHNGTWSPLFWGANVYELGAEIANNREGAVRMAWWALKIHEEPELRKWRPREQKWAGEP